MKLLLGDVIWVSQSGYLYDIIIERKTVEDLSSSIIDG